jgi:peptidoglycan/LPS O-acetylase OafA/YrhL
MWHGRSNGTQTSGSASPAAGAPLLDDRGERLVFIDGLRGVAALAVMFFHFFHADISPVHAPLTRVFPAPLQALLRNGDLGVVVFFVLSGFVIAYTLRGRDITFGYAGNFMLRRSVRLDPPYWTMNGIRLGWQAALWHKQAAAFLWSIGGPWSVLANMFYLQDILRNNGLPQIAAIIGVAWTLCLEVQFYLALITLLALSCWARRRWGRLAGSAVFLAIAVPLTLISLYVWFAQRSFNFLGMWFMFAAGTALWWTLRGRVRASWLCAMVTLIAIGGLWRSDGRALMTVATVCILYAGARSRGMYRWLDNRVIQYFGRISYSLYLSHLIVAAPVLMLVWTHSDKSRVAAVCAYVASCAVAIGFADLLHRLIEAPCIRWSHRLKPAVIRQRATSATPTPVAVIGPDLDDAEPLAI